GRRFCTLLEQIGDAVGESVPMACQDWANTKGSLSLSSNERVDGGDILAGHFQATRDRFAASDGTVLVLRRNSRFKEKVRIASVSLTTSRFLPAEYRREHRRRANNCNLLMVSNGPHLPPATGAGAQPQRGYRHHCGALKRQLCGQPYMRTDLIK